MRHVWPVFIVAFASLGALASPAARKDCSAKRVTLLRQRNGRPPLESAKAVEYLCRLGVREEVISGLTDHMAERLVEAFRRGFPRQYAPELDTGAPVRMTGELQRLFADEDVSALRSGLKERIGPREHVFRSGAEYREDAAGLDAVKHPVMLKLLRILLEHMDAPGRACELNALFPKGRESLETGGVFLWESRPVGDSDPPRLRFVELPPDHDDPLGRNKLFYLPGPMDAFLEVPAGLHTHPPRIGVDPQNVAGPSGENAPSIPTGVRSAELLTFVRSPDFASLFTVNGTNPFHIDLVITWVGDGAYDVDAYFRDAVSRPGAHAVTNVDAVSVLDFGVYHCVP